VDNVSWNDIVDDFLPKLEKVTGKKYRLPTEAQWNMLQEVVTKARDTNTQAAIT
jgi:formylglycine-generating enzyme required for sulfatase activity